MKFVQGLRIDEDSIKAKFDRHMEELRGNANYLPDLGYSTVTLAKEESELWQQKTKAGYVQAHIKTHLYFSDEPALNAKKTLLSNVENIIKAKNANQKVSRDDWSCYGK